MARRHPSLPHVEHWAFAYCVAHSVWYVAWIATGPTGAGAELVNDLAFLPLWLVGGWLALRAGGLASAPRVRRAWRLLGAAHLAVALGNALYAVAHHVGARAFFDAATDLVVPLWYPLVLAGILTFPVAPRHASERRRFWLDAAIVFVAASAILWHLFVQPILRAAGAWQSAASFFYATGDAVVLFGVVVLLMRAPQIDRPALGYLVAGLALSVWADLAWARSSGLGEYTPRGMVDATFMIGAAMLCASGWSACRAMRRSAAALRSSAPGADGRQVPHAASRLPYAAVVVVFALLVLDTRDSWTHGRAGLTVAAVVLTALVLLRQLLALRENEELGRREREQDARYRALVQRASDLITVVDENAVVRYQSPSALRALGAAAGDGHRLVDVAHPDDRERLLAAVAAPAAHAGPIRWRTAGASGAALDLESVLTDLRSEPSVRGIVLNSRDVTDQLALQAQLRQAQKMEAVGLLAGGIAHDFNNLLAAISSAAELIKEDRRGDESPAELELIEQAARRGASLTRQLLAFSSRQVVQPRLIDLGRTVAGMGEMLHRLVAKRAELAIEPAAGQLPVVADPGQLEQVVMNLVLNARDAVQHEGRIAVQCTRGHGPQGPTAVLTVSDTGVGMNDQTRQRIFEPFFTTKPPGEGSGLGLSTVYAIVSQCGGEVQVSSSPGNGSTFRIALPLATQTELAADASRSEPAVGGAETILVVDDEAAVRSSIGRYLSRRGYQVLLAEDGAAGLECMQTSPSRVQLLVTDMVMPRMGGRELIERARSADPGLRVICMSGYTEDEVLARGGEAAPRFLQKPFSLESLATAVRAELDLPSRT